MIRDHTLAELQQLDAGYHFSLDGGRTFPFRRSGVGIPTLAEVLNSFPGLRITVEIKQTDPPIEEHVIAVVRDCGRAEEVILASQHDQVVARVRALAPDIATNCATGEVTEFIQRVSTGQLAGYHPRGQALQIPTEYHGIPLVTTETVAAAHALGREVHVWTINDPAEMEKLFQLGVDGIMSDFPSLLLAVARRYAATKS
jgi:glycerophosphoryl diester phosphodiesterase